MFCHSLMFSMASARQEKMAQTTRRKNIRKLLTSKRKYRRIDNDIGFASMCSCVSVRRYIFWILTYETES